jgi:hypothetical protein
MPQDALLTEKDVAALLACKPHVVRRLPIKKNLPADCQKAESPLHTPSAQCVSSQHRSQRSKISRRAEKQFALEQLDSVKAALGQPAALTDPMVM